MELLRTTLYGLTTAYADEPATLDCAGLAGSLTAVVGPNGAGKSTLLGAAILGALYRNIPSLKSDRTRSLASLAVQRGAYVESTFALSGDLGTLTFRQVVDTDDARPESLVTLPTGAHHPNLTTGSVKSFDAWAARRLPPRDVVRAALFLSQQSHGVVAMTEGDRKSVILRAIGSERLERLAELARKRATSAAEALARVSGSLDASVGASVVDARAVLAQAERDREHAERVASTAGVEAAWAVDAATATERLNAAYAACESTADAYADAQAEALQAGQARQDVETANRLRDAARIAETNAAHAHERADRAATEVDRATEEHTRAQARLRSTQERWGAEQDRLNEAVAQARTERDQCRARLHELAGVVGRRDEIVAAVARVNELDELRRAQQVKRDDALASAAKVGATLASVQAQHVAAVAEVRRIEAEIARLRGRLTDADDVRAAVARLAEIVATTDQQKAEIARLRSVLASQQDRATNGLVRRHGALVLALERISDGPTDPANIARLALAQDDRDETTNRDLPEAIQQTQRAIEQLTNERGALLADGANVVKPMASRLSDVERDEAAFAEHEAALVQAKERATTLLLAVVGLQRDAKRAKDAVSVAEQQAHYLAGEIATIQPTAGLLARLESATERAADLERQAQHADERAVALTSEARTVPERSVPDIAAHHGAVRIALARVVAVARDVETARADAQTWVERARAVRVELDALADPEGRLVRAERASERLALLQEQRCRCETALLDARAACDDIDAAGAPTVSEGQERLRVAREALRDAEIGVVRAQDALARAIDAAAVVDRLTAEKADVQRTLTRWRGLAADLGRDGLQAALIDAVVPELNEVANDLLTASFGGRYRLTFSATKERGDGATVEGFTIMVADLQTGRLDEAANWSGGETALIATAASDAIAVVACRLGGIVRPTLVRDEADAALNPALIRPWIEMLRRTATIVNVSRLFIVTQRPETIALCDSVVEVAGGKIRVAR